MARRRARTALAFLAPALTIIAVFVLWPMAIALRTSFTDSRILGDANWVGLANYTRLATDDRFTNALANTGWYAVVTTPVSVALALAFALLLNQIERAHV